MTRLWGAIGLLAGNASAASAQVDGVGTWLWEVTTDNGDAIVQPGETATVTLSMDMEPDVNYPFGPVLGFAGAIFDTLGQANADKGEILGWTILNDLDVLFGDPTTTDGVSLFGSNPAQFSELDSFITDDPIDVITFYWAPLEVGVYDVGYATSTEFLGVWIGDTERNEAVIWPNVVEAEITFAVIPAPSTVLAMGALSSWALLRRPVR